MKIEEIAKKFLGDDYIKFPTKFIDEQQGHGNTLSIKIVLPVWCQANCPFCFNKVNKKTQVHNLDMFLENLKTSLTLLKDNLPTRDVTFDITGNEPTYNIKLLKDVLIILNEFNTGLVKKIVLTTNGYNLHRFENLDPVNIVNISLHHYDFEERKKIFKTNNIPTDEELKELCKKFNITAVAVFDENRKDLESFTKDFAKWAQKIGFKNVRIRTNYLSIGKVFFNAFEDAKIEEYPGLCIKDLMLDGFSVKLYRGIEDLTTCILGTEVIIDDDGKLYLDYYKRYPIGQEEIKAFNNNLYIKQKEKQT